MWMQAGHRIKLVTRLVHLGFPMLGERSRLSETRDNGPLLPTDTNFPGDKHNSQAAFRYLLGEATGLSIQPSLA